MTKTVSDYAVELADREAIRDCLTRYARANDRCDEALLKSVFWPDAITEYEGFFAGPVGEYIEKSIMATSQLMEQTAHLLGNMLIEINGNSAAAECYVFAFHRLPGVGGPQDLLLGGRYLDQLEKRADRWRIRQRTLICDWFREFADSADWAKGFFGLKMTSGGRFPTDRSYEYFAPPAKP
jgi:hypothetical protein